MAILIHTSYSPPICVDRCVPPNTYPVNPVNPAPLQRSLQIGRRPTHGLTTVRNALPANYSGGPGFVPDSVPAEPIIQLSPGLHRSRFPENLVFGAASSAFQFEGALNVDGRKTTIWDKWVKVKGKIFDGSSPEITCNQYFFYKEHVQMLKKTGLEAYRFSIAWSRLFDPTTGAVNPYGLNYYNSFISELTDNGIKPYATLYHWELPDVYQDGPASGWLNKDGTMIQKFVDYATFCFAAFGDRVKNWITFNEPWSEVKLGYTMDVFPPGVSSTEDPTRDPYKATHNILLAHAAVADVYRTRFQKRQGGEIGITLCSKWSEPLFHTSSDLNAAHRAIEFELGWFLHPLVHGTYPQSMIDRVGDRLPKFSSKEVEKVKGSLDFLGINYYTAQYVREGGGGSTKKAAGYEADLNVDVSDQIIAPDLNPVLIGPYPPGDYTIGEHIKIPPFNPMVPWGFSSLLGYINNNYSTKTNKIKMVVTENGTMQLNLQDNKVLDDDFRIKFLSIHLTNLQMAVRSGIDIRGYFVWSYFDNWEWMFGYLNKYGMVTVDHTNANEFIAEEKTSAKWFREFLNT